MKHLVKKVGRRVPIVKKLVIQNDNLQVDKGVLQLEKGELQAAIRERDTIINSKRNFLAQRYLSGHGIEIGAAQLPVKLPPHTSVQYVDFFTADDLRKVFPLYNKLDIVEIDVVDDGEKLDKFKDGSLDFIIANHFLEHCIDPIGTLLNMYKKLRKEGVLYMAIPDKRYTFDKPRPLTTYQHLLDEHADKTHKKFHLEHTVEYVTTKLGKKANKAKVDARVQELLESGYRVHYHVWTQREMTEMFARAAQDFNIDFEIEALLKNYHEVVYVLRKQPVHKEVTDSPQI